MNRRVFLGIGFAAAPVCASVALFRGALPSSHAGEAPLAGPRVATARVSDFGTDAAALQRAIDSDAREVIVDASVTVVSDVRLRSNQTLRFTQGRLHVPSGARFAKAVLYGERVEQSAILGAVIERTGNDAGVTGIRLVDSNGVRVEGGRLTGANIMLESYDGAVHRDIEVAGLTVDMAGWNSAAIYVSGVAGVVLRDVDCFGGAEGVGVYNGARAVRLTRVSSHDHVRDGFVIIAGHDVSHDDCRAYDNGQSGFTTQRQTSGTDSRDCRWTRCVTSGNGFDGFDMRGAVSRPWGVATGFVLTGCRADDNRRCGFYVVMAEGTTLIDCGATGNDAQNLFVDNSDDVRVRGFRSFSGASTVAPGPNKAGILVYDSQSIRFEQPISRNEGAETQDFGLSLTGRSAGGRLTGGSLTGNSVRAVYAAVNTLSIL